MDAARLAKVWLPRLLIGAMVLRALAAIGLDSFLEHRLHQQYLILGDAEGYWDLAGDIADGREYAVYEPPRRVLRMPGFPAVLALSRVCFGEHLLPARLILAIVGTLACWGVWKLGQLLAGELVGLIACAYVAACPAMVLFSVMILSETTFAATLVISLVCGAKLVRHGNGHSDPTGPLIGPGQGASHAVERSTADPPPGINLRWALLTGLSIAAATYVRPSWLLTAPLFALCLPLCGRGLRNRLVEGGLVCGVVLLALLPWGYRNQAATGHFVLTSLWMGPSLYDGLHPGATGDSDMAFYDRDNLQAGGLSEYAVNQHYKQAAVDFVKANPGRTLELAAIKTWRFWKPWPNAGQFGGPLGAAAIAIPYLPLVLLAMWGAVRGGGGCWTRLLSAGPILYFAALHMVFVSSLRYRLPAEYPLAVLAAIGLLTLRNRSGNNTCLPPQPTPEV